jgi:hypothetical protein
MPRVGFEPKIPVFEQEQTVHALDRAAAVASTAILVTTNLTWTALGTIEFINCLILTSSLALLCVCVC